MKRVVAVILVLLVAGGCAVTEKPPSVEELLSLGDQYLLDLDYDQALVQFLKVIEAEPMNAKAYLGAAQAYVGLGETDSAVALLRQGLEATGDESLRELLESLTAQNLRAYWVNGSQDLQSYGIGWDVPEDDTNIKTFKTYYKPYGASDDAYRETAHPGYQRPLDGYFGGGGLALGSVLTGIPPATYTFKVVAEYVEESGLEPMDLVVPTPLEIQLYEGDIQVESAVFDSATRELLLTGVLPVGGYLIDIDGMVYGTGGVTAENTLTHTLQGNANPIGKDGALTYCLWTDFGNSDAPAVVQIREDIPVGPIKME